MGTNDGEAEDPSSLGNTVSRRAFVSSGIAGAVLLSSGLSTVAEAAAKVGSPFAAAPKPDPIWMEKSIPELQALLASG